MVNTPFINDIIAFCILMQNNNGILYKSPTYIQEKFKACMSGYYSLDSFNQSIFNQYLETWHPNTKEDEDNNDSIL